jgi:DNA-binding XRE family transcriptional regulator
MKRTRDKEVGIDWHPQWEGANLAEVERLEHEALELNFLRNLRKELGLTQIDLARILHITQAGVSKIENRKTLDLSVLTSLAESQDAHLKMSLDLPDGRSIDLMKLAA